MYLEGKRLGKIRDVDVKKKVLKVLVWVITTEKKMNFFSERKKSEGVKYDILQIITQKHFFVLILFDRKQNFSVSLMLIMRH